MAKVRVLIIDDSALIREVLTQILSKDPGIEVVGTARDPIDAWPKLTALAPDVLTLDVEMPRQDGLSFLERVMREKPMPVVMVSSLTHRGCETTLRALELGAFDFVEKPKLDLQAGTFALASELVEKVKAARVARVFARHVPSPTPVQSPGIRAPDPAAPAQGARARATWNMPSPARATLSPREAQGSMLRTTDVIVALGASTGGTEALREVIGALPEDSPPIVVVQHMPPRFTKSFAERLDSLSRVRVLEASDGDRVLRGQVLLAPGDYHMTLCRSGAHYLVRLDQEPRHNNFRPSVDRLFESVARVAGRNAVGALMTGMGGDGARGLLAMRNAGARTIAQDEATCAVFGMPAVAIALGAAERVVGLPDIAATVLSLAR